MKTQAIDTILNTTVEWQVIRYVCLTPAYRAEEKAIAEHGVGNITYCYFG